MARGMHAWKRKPPKGGMVIAAGGPIVPAKCWKCFARSLTINHMTPCIGWLGSVDKGGYGYLNTKRPDGRWRTERAHRLAFEMGHGFPPGSGWVLHSCHNPKCINPEHLRLGSNADNMADRAASGRSRSGHDKYRHLVPQVRELCRNATQRSVALHLGIPKSVVGDIMSGACWKDVP